MNNATNQEWRQLVADVKSGVRPERLDKPDPLGVVLDLGLQVKVGHDGQVKVAGLNDLSKGDARKAAQLVRDHAAAIKAQLHAIEAFGVRYPGHCGTCKAFADNWPITRNGVRHSQWCVHQAAFLGKSGLPVKIEWDPRNPFKNRAQCPLNRRS